MESEQAEETGSGSARLSANKRMEYRLVLREFACLLGQQLAREHLAEQRITCELPSGKASLAAEAVDIDLMGWTAPAPGIDVPYRGRR